MTLPKGSGPCHAGTDRQAQRLALRRGIARSQSTISIRSRASAFGAFASALVRPRTIASRSVRCALSTLRNLQAILVFLEDCSWTTKQAYAAHPTITRRGLLSFGNSCAQSANTILLRLAVGDARPHRRRRLDTAPACESLRQGHRTVCLTSRAARTSGPAGTGQGSTAA